MILSKTQNSRSEFPAKIGKKAFKWLFFFYALTLLAIGSSLRMFIHKHIDINSDWVPRFLGELDQFLIYIFWTLLILGTVYFVFFVWRFFAPLGSLLLKSRNIRRGSLRKREVTPIEESRGEWYQLDLALNKIHRDLKKRKADAARERGELEALVSAANDAILAIDHEQNIRYYNAPMALLLEQKEEGSWGKTLKSVIRNRAIHETFEKVLETGKGQSIQISHQGVMDVLMKHFEVSISPLSGEKKNRTFGAVAIFHDITEHKKTEKVRMDFVANASHELKTPVTSIQGYLGMLKDKVDGNKPELADTFNVIEKNLNRLNLLVSDLLKLTKIEGTEEVEWQELHVEDVTSQIVQELEPQWKSKKIQINCKYGCEKILSNREYLEHILINLIENAIKYCGEGAEIRIKWTESDEGIYMSVKDNGPGIESYHLGRLFERFYRVRDSVEAQQARGTGLGLSIVRHSVINLGGKIDVKSAPGLGTEFICFFPIKN